MFAINIQMLFIGQIYWNQQNITEMTMIHQKIIKDQFAHLEMVLMNLVIKKGYTGLIHHILIQDPNHHIHHQTNYHAQDMNCMLILKKSVGQHGLYHRKDTMLIIAKENVHFHLDKINCQQIMPQFRVSFMN